MKLVERLLPSEEDEERVLERELRVEPSAAAQPAPKPLALYWLAGLWAAALLPRLYALFWLTDPENAGDGWHGDVYHHWQIAYLTKQIGLTAPDGPRLWDLKGLDYFWGLIHPLMLVALFYLTGSIDIVLARLLTIFFGALVVVLIFALCRRHWGTGVAVAAAAFAALAPTSVFVDSTGFLEPIGVGFCLLGIWLWPKRGLWTGVAWALAAMARAEAWVFSFGMIVASFLRRESVHQRLPMVLAWGVGILLYMKVLLDHTGNPIYPVYWNFLANAYGKWEFRSSLSADQVAIRPFLGALLVFGAIGLAWTLWKRPRSYMFLTFGFGYLVFTGGMLGFTAYLKSWESWFWMERFFLFPYEFAAVLAAIALLVFLPRRVRPLSWGLIVIALLAVQLEWPPILAMYQRTQAPWANAVTTGKALGAVYNQPPYQGYALAVPDGNADVTYTLARYGGVEGRHLVSELYDPFYYTPAGYTYRDHPETGATLMRCWLSKENVRLMAFDDTKPNYVDMIRDHPEWFQPVTVDTPGFGWTVVGVQVPAPDAAECKQAAEDSQR